MNQPLVLDPNRRGYSLETAARTRVAKELVERRKRSFDRQADAFLDLPGVPHLSERERLAFYETTDLVYWNERAKRFPEKARAEILDWGRLTRKYRAMDPVTGTMVPV